MLDLLFGLVPVGGWAASFLLGSSKILCLHKLVLAQSPQIMSGLWDGESYPMFMGCRGMVGSFSSVKEYDRRWLGTGEGLI